VWASRPAADTIFFGGGTPSLLEPDEIARIIAACESAFDVATDREVTMEANPESVTEARLAAYRRAGITRLRFGVQSFREDELRRCRASTARIARVRPSAKPVPPASTTSAST
jgi:oxygen-independent coproporphyrinogen-3 oxidase